MLTLTYLVFRVMQSPRDEGVEDLEIEVTEGSLDGIVQVVSSG